MKEPDYTINGGYQVRAIFKDKTKMSTESSIELVFKSDVPSFPIQRDHTSGFYDSLIDLAYSDIEMGTQKLEIDVLSIELVNNGKVTVIHQGTRENEFLQFKNIEMDTLLKNYF